MDDRWSRTASSPFAPSSRGQHVQPGEGDRVRLRLDRPRGPERRGARSRPAADPDGDAALGTRGSWQLVAAAACDFAAYVAALVARYGPDGSFWARTRTCRSGRFATGRYSTSRGFRSTTGRCCEAAHRPRSRRRIPARRSCSLVSPAPRRAHAVGRPELPVPPRGHQAMVRHRRDAPVHRQGRERRRRRPPVQAGDAAPRATARSRCG